MSVCQKNAAFFQIISLIHFSDVSSVCLFIFPIMFQADHFFCFISIKIWGYKEHPNHQPKPTASVWLRVGGRAGQKYTYK